MQPLNALFPSMDAGRELFAEAMADGMALGFFHLIQQVCASRSVGPLSLGERCDYHGSTCVALRLQCSINQSPPRPQQLE